MVEDRRHAAIMFTDIVGYTKLMGSDEDKAFDMLTRNHTIHETLIKKHNGILIKEIGDGTLASFPLATNAVRCAVDIQEEAKDQNIPLKIGIHEGEMVFAGSDVLGDSVNIASRLQEDAQEGCINISASVYRDIKNKADIQTKFIDEKSFKNVDEAIKVYKVICGEEEIEDQTRKDGKVKKPRSKLPYYILSGTIVVIVAIILIWKLIPIKESVELEKSIAVKPFFNDSGDKGNEYFVNGMMEDIRNNLSKISDLRVISRTTMEKYRDTNLSTSEIAKELDVSYLLEGSVQKLGNQVKIHAQLINAEDDDHIWEHSYERDLSNIKEVYKIQSGIAMIIAEEIGANIKPAEASRIEEIPTINPLAYDYYQRGFQSKINYHNRLNVIDLELSNIQLEKAIQLDSSYAKAYSLLADNYFHIYFFEGGGIALKDSALLLCEKAILINPNLSDPHRIKGYILNSISDAKKAISLDPNSSIAYDYLGVVHMRNSEFSESLINYLKALELDEYNPRYHNNTGLGYMNLLFDEEAEKYLNNSIDLQPDFYWAYGNLLYLSLYHRCYEDELKYAKIIYNLNPNDDWSLHRMGVAYTHLDNYVEAEKYFRKCEKIIRDSTFHETSDSAPFRYRLAFVLWQMDQKEEAIILFNEQMERDNFILHDGDIPGAEVYYLAAVNAFLGNKEEAFYWLEKYKELKPWEVIDTRLVEQEELFNSIKEDERFKAIIKEIKDYVLREREKFEQSDVKGIL